MSFRGFEWFIETVILRGRWLLVVFFLGLMVGILALAIRFVCSTLGIFGISVGPWPDVDVGQVLELVDTALVASLLMIIAYSGYEIFVSSIDDNRMPKRNQPKIMLNGKEVEFSDLKINLMSAIVAISGVKLLKVFLDIAEVPEKAHDERILAWMVGIHLTFAISVLLFAISDRFAHRKASAQDHGGILSAKEPPTVP